MDAASKDWALLFAWRNGDRRAGNALATRYFDLLLRFFINKVRDMDDAAELVSETFLACTKARDRATNTSSFRSYLLAIAMNKLRGYYRKQAKRQRELDDFEELCVNTSLRSSPSSLIGLTQEVQLLTQGLCRLSLAQQIIIELQIFEGMTVAEIAELIEVPRPTVSTHLRRGKQRLAKVVQELSENPDLAQSTLLGIKTWAGQIRAALAEQNKSAAS